jgi:DNA mismatch repair protein MutS
VVPNDWHLDPPERLLVVTGANQGGKTTFARAFGQLHHLASLGLPVPARRARVGLHDRLLTHFERQERIATLRGKLEDELMRVHALLEQATPDSVVFLNETFSSTTLQDARELGTAVLERLERVGARAVFVTFVDELASVGRATVSMVATVAPDDPTVRTFKVVRRPPDGLAHAVALAERYGLTYESIQARATP